MLGEGSPQEKWAMRDPDPSLETRDVLFQMLFYFN